MCNYICFTSQPLSAFYIHTKKIETHFNKTKPNPFWREGFFNELLLLFHVLWFCTLHRPTPVYSGSSQKLKEGTKLFGNFRLSKFFLMLNVWIINYYQFWKVFGNPNIKIIFCTFLMQNDPLCTPVQRSLEGASS